MSLKPQAQSTVPAETARVAHAIFPSGNLCITMEYLYQQQWID